MKDRVPTQIVSGAVRMAQYNADGTLQGYIYLKRADDPVEEGTPYCKNTVLTDDTANALEIKKDNPTPNDAFMASANGVAMAKNALKYILFPYTAYTITENTTITLHEAGFYRITANAKGGNGSNGVVIWRWDEYTQDYTNECDVPGSGGGGGATCVIQGKFTAGQALAVTFNNGGFTINGIATVTAGADGAETYIGESGQTTGHEEDIVYGIGGVGGTATALTNQYKIETYNGYKGMDASFSAAGTGGYVGWYVTEQPSSGDKTAAQKIRSSNTFGNGGKGAKNSISTPTFGGDAKIIVEYMGG